MYKRVPKAIKEEILGKIKGGMSVADGSSQYGISAKTIYNWMAKQTRLEVSVLEHNRLRRENEELKRVIGVMTLELERGKK